jgi:hypothetical protein
VNLLRAFKEIEAAARHDGPVPEIDVISLIHGSPEVHAKDDTPPPGESLRRDSTLLGSLHDFQLLDKHWRGGCEPMPQLIRPQRMRLTVAVPTEDTPVRHEVHIGGG